MVTLAIQDLVDTEGMIYTLKVVLLVKDISCCEIRERSPDNHALLSVKQIIS